MSVVVGPRQRILNTTDPDAAAFLAAAGITDPTIEGAVNTLVVDMKAANI